MKTLMVLVGCAAMSFVAVREVAVQGTYSASGALPGGTWEAIVVPDTGRVRGAMTYADGNVIPLDGTLVDGTVDFQIVAPGRVRGHLTGQVTGTTISGTYTVGNAQGTWSGEASVALPAN
jgi:hypothetical protein